ncbi:transketolase [Streptomyces ipomoeae]|uniref:transketolase n=1 Tax=Streptomyces ipomoeae TaxID=103232 RepID=UPI0029A81D99|nr:transketolase [Streptomyces ipomoeae]MDX2825277.1 transketolase [Streptomyces ipomoeae]MDX2877530.1 transketolase [Streptomyces ipomoeae]
MQTDMLLVVAETLPEPKAEGADHDPGPVGTVLVGYGAVDELNRYAAAPGWTVHVPGHPEEVRRAITGARARGEHAYVHVSARSNTDPRDTTAGFQLVRPGLDGVILAVGSALDPVLRATAGLDLAVLYATTVRPFDEIGLRTAVLAADHADVILVEPCLPGTSARHVAETLVHVPHRLLALGDADGLDENGIAQAVRDFMR